MITEEDDFTLNPPDDIQWRRDLDKHVAQCAKRWNLAIEGTISPGWVSVVLNVVCEGKTPAVLKIRRPGKNAKREANALRAFAGKKCVRLLEFDPTIAAALLERVIPGQQLRESDPPEQDLAMIEIMRTLWVTMPNERAGTLEDEADRLADNMEQVASDEWEFGTAARQLRVLAESQDAWSVMLHGNLHVGNVLCRQDGWVTVSPRGYMGEREFDAGWWLRDPPTTADGFAPKALRRKLDVMVDQLGIDRERTLLWARSLSACVIAARLAVGSISDARRHGACLAVLERVVM